MGLSIWWIAHRKFATFLITVVVSILCILFAPDTILLLFLIWLLFFNDCPTNSIEEAEHSSKGGTGKFHHTGGK